MTIARHIPWWGKIAAKIALSRLPLGRRLLQRLPVFRHGAMDDPAYAIANFRRHHERARRLGLAADFVCLELGPGDSLASAPIARAFGGQGCWLVDSGNFARTDMAVYQALTDSLRNADLPTVDTDGCRDIGEFMAACRARYLTRGLESLRTIPDGAVDFIWSQAVLEHVRLEEFAATMAELRRVMSANGVCSHRVDLRDHLAQSLNNLRFADKVWESDLIANSGFYTNRIRFCEMIRHFERAGFAVDVVGIDRWDAVPTPRASMAERFRRFDDDELSISGFDVVLTPAAGTAARGQVTAADGA